MRHIAIVGSGPAGYYTAEACTKTFGENARVDIIDRMPVPFGLIRTGVAPDHQSIKAVSQRYDAVSLGDNVRFIGNVSIGQDVSIAELLSLYDAVVLATGAPNDRTLDVPGDDLPGVIGSAAFVGWYNGHPDHATLSPPLNGDHAVILGNGNVALDVARILAKTPEEFAGSDIARHALDVLAQSSLTQITIIGRRGPHQIAMTPKELEELERLERADMQVSASDFPPVAEDAALEPGLRKSVGLLRTFAGRDTVNKPMRVTFDFFAMPVAVEGEGKVERLIVEQTQVDEDGHLAGTGEQYAIEADMIISCIGYRTPPIEGVPYDVDHGRFANQDGRIAPGLYCVGWARRGPTGTIGTNRPDGYDIVERIASDLASAVTDRSGDSGLDALLNERGVAPVYFSDWQRIDAAERDRARDGAPREKFTTVEDMLAAAHGEDAAR